LVEQSPQTFRDDFAAALHRRIRSELQPNLRSFPCGNYVIYYRPLEGDLQVEIIRVWHGARDVESILGSQQFDDDPL